MDNLEKLRQLEQEASQLRQNATQEVQAEISRIEADIRALTARLKGTGINVDLYLLRDSVEDLHMAADGSDWNGSSC